VVGSVGVTSAALSTELEHPAVTMAASVAAANSLFMRSLLGILLMNNPVAFPRRTERCAELVMLGQ
jgi:hypothetical protein